MRETRRAAALNAPKDQIAAAAEDLYGKKPVVAAPGVRGGAPTMPLAEYQMSTYATGEDAKAIKALKSPEWLAAPDPVKAEAFTQASQVSGGNGLPWSKTFTEYPAVALAAAKAINNGQLSRDQLKTVVDAVEITNKATQLLTANSDITRQHIMQNLSEPKQASVLSVAFALNDELNALRAKTMTESGDQSPILQALGKVGGAVINALNWANEQGQHYGRAWQYAWKEGTDPIAAWRETEIGKFDEETIQALKADYGDLLVDVAKDVVRAQRGEEDFTWADLLSKYAGSQEALNIIDAVILESERPNVPGIEDVLGRMNAARLDNLGGGVANTLLPEGMEGTSPLWTGLSKGTNVVSIFALDPTLGAGKAWRGYQSFRYGLERAYGTGELPKLFSNPQTRKFFNSVGEDIVRYNEANIADAGKIAGEMRVKYGKYLNDDAIESLANYVKVEGKGGVTDPQRLVFNWVEDMDGYTKLLNGQAMRRPGDRLVPRMTPARAAIIKSRLGVRNLISFDKKNDAIVNAIIGADAEALDYKAAKAFGIDPRTVSAEKVADLISDPAVQDDLINYFGVEPSGWAARMLSNQPSNRTIRNRMDKIFRKLEYIPRGLEIKISDSSDSRKVYQWARTTFSKNMAETLAETWKYATIGDRRRILSGMFETMAKARGIDLDEVLEDGTKLRDKILTSGSKQAEQYAATVGGFEAVPFGTPLQQYSNRLTRAVLPRLDRAAQDRVNAINAKLAGFFDEQRNLQTQIESLRGEIAAQRELLESMPNLDKQINSLIDDLEGILKSVKDEKGRAWGGGKALLNERKALMANQEAFYYNPAEVAGRQHAIHLFQMADSLRVPDFALIQRYQQRKGVLNKLLGYVAYGEKPTTLVDYWSGFNLASPRYVMRNAPEDWAGYVLSGGSLSDALRGRAMMTASRELYGRKLGMVMERSREAADRSSMYGKWFLDHMPEDDVRLFLDAIKTNDLDIAEGIIGSAFARIQSTMLGRTLDKTDEAFFKAFSATPDARRVVDRVAEIRGDLNSGRLISTIDEGPAPQVRADLDDLRQPKRGMYTNVEFDKLDTDAYVAWYDMLMNILHSDGTPGQIVFNAMRYADKYKEGLVSAGWEKYKQKLIDYFSDMDKASEWWSKSSMLQEVGPEQFARRYFDATSNYFSRSGIVNGDLVSRLTRTNPETGAKYGALYLKDGNEILQDGRITIDGIRKYGKWEHPEFILGKTEQTIGGTDDIRALDKVFGYLAESLGRISREPIFFANALGEWRASQPMLKRLVADGLDEKAASKIVMDSVLQRAEQLTVSYIDNPNVRTQLAFNARNIARYYRATEDFYRRVMRLASYRPEQIQKLNIVYQNLTNSGFVHEDDMGTQYFIYPGTGIANDAVATGLKILGLGSASLTNPFVFGGQTLMLTPSTDPTSLLPTFASPIMAVPTKLLTSVGGLEWLEPILLGARGTRTAGSAPDLATEIVQSALPAPFLRAWALMDNRERDTQLASATTSALRFAAYANTYEMKPGESAEAFKARVKEEVGIMAWSVLGLRFILGFLVPASPQTLSADDLTTEARKMGIKNLRQGYTKLLNKYEGDYDRATAEWFALNPKLMPFTVSSTEAKGQGFPSLSSESGKWLIANSDFVANHPSASPFLTPDGEDFSFSTYNLTKALKMIQGKTVDDAFRELFTQKDYYSYMETKADAEAAIAAEPSTARRNQYREQWAQLQQEFFAENPFLEERVKTLKGQSNEALKKSALQDMRLALKDIYSNRKGMVNERTDKIMSMINTFDDGMAAVARYGGTSNYAEDMRQYNRDQLRTILQEIAGDDRGAQDFYDRILDSLIGG